MALITGCNTGKHPAAPLPGTKACPRCRRAHGSSTHAGSNVQFPPHCESSTNCDAFRMENNCNLQNHERKSRQCDVNRWWKWLGETDWLQPRTKALYQPEKNNKHATKNLCSRIELWSKYRCRVTVSLWPRTYRMGGYPACTNADAEEQALKNAWRITSVLQKISVQKH